MVNPAGRSVLVELCRSSQMMLAVVIFEDVRFMRMIMPCNLKQPAVLAAAVLVTAVLAASPLLARDIYVNNAGGDDRFDGGNELFAQQGTGPCRTIAKALRVARAGDRIILVKNEEPYRECITLTGRNHSAFAKEPLIIDGRGAILDGTRAVPDAWRHVSGQVFCFQPKRMNHQMLYLDGKPAEEIKAANHQMPKLAPLQWCHYRGAIYFATEPGRIPTDYNLRHTHHQVGIGLYKCEGVVINNLVVQGYQLDGINAHDDVRDIQIQGVTLRGNGRSGLSVGGASRVQLEVSLVGNNGDAQVRTEGFCRLKLVDCDLLDNTAPALVKKGGRVTIEKTPAPAAPAK